MTDRQRQTGISTKRRFDLLRWRYLWVLLLGLLLASSFFFDPLVVAWVKAHQTPGWLTFMRAVSRWGDWPPLAAAGTLALGIAVALQRRDWTAIFAAMLIAMTVGSVVNRVIKISAGRSRPSITVDAGWNGLRWTSKYHSFPSGHTASSAAFFSTLFLARRRIGRYFLALPVLIAFSRLYLDAHYLSDVLFGGTIGATCAWLVWRAISNRQVASSDLR